MKRSNKKMLSIVLVIIVIAVFIMFAPTDFTKTPYTEQNQPSMKKENTRLKHTPTPNRSIASLPSKIGKDKKSLNRQIVGELYDLKKIKFNNKVRKDWKEKYETNFLRMASVKDVKNLKIKLKRSILKVKNNVGTNYEHIIVSYNKPNGQPFSFEALIDSETGSLVKTWNQTKYEYKKPSKIEGSKYLYQKEED